MLGRSRGAPNSQEVTMKLRQGQVWKKGEEFIRLVRLERLQVEYKSTTDLAAKKGTHHQTGKKEFCRLLKSAILLAPVETPKSSPPSPQSTTDSPANGAALGGKRSQPKS